MKSDSLKAVAALVGTTIGVGIFALPYAFVQAGLGIGLLLLVFLSFATLLLNLAYGEVILRTPGDHQLTGYAGIYLGRLGKILALAAMLVGLYGALLAYLIKTGDFLALLLGGDPTALSLIFFALAAAAVFFGLRAISRAELLLTGLMLVLIGLVAAIGLPHFSVSHLTASPPHLLASPSPVSSSILLYGILLFALSGFGVIPEVEEILRNHHRCLKKAIGWGTAVPAVAYLLFALTVVGICGQLTSDDAIRGLGLFLPGWVVKVGAFLGILTMVTSFLTLGFVLREVFFRDLKLNRRLSWFLACFVPLFLFLLGARNFVAVLEITGALSGGLTGILILGIFGKAKTAGKRVPAYTLNLPPPAVWLLILVFVLGAGAVLLN